MKRSKSCTSLFVALILAAASVAAHAESLLDRVKQHGELVVGTEMQFAPFDFLENGQQAGFNKALFAAVGQIIGVKVRFIDLPWESVLPGLDAGKFDMVAGPLTVTKARMERYAFSLPIAERRSSLLNLYWPEFISRVRLSVGTTWAMTDDAKPILSTNANVAPQQEARIRCFPSAVIII